MNIKMIVTYGLPGSGKTHFAKEYCENNKHTKRIDCDWIQNAWIQKGRYNVADVICSTIKGYPGTNFTIVVDGLFLKSKDVTILVNEIQKLYHIDELEIHYFKPDIEVCLYNDLGRRSLSCKNTILNADCEKPNEDFIKKMTNICKVSVIEHEIVKKPSISTLYDIGNGTTYDTISSNDWCIGGTYGSCWDDYLKPCVVGEPDDFSVLRDVVNSIYPNLPKEKFDDLWNACVEYTTHEEHDYYGGVAEYAKYTCNLETLYNYMRDYLGYNENKVVQDILQNVREENCDKDVEEKEL